MDNFTTVAKGERRNSVRRFTLSYVLLSHFALCQIRLTSQAFYDFGTLWIMDARHLPYGCSVWPAFWSTAPDWPDGGEIGKLTVYRPLRLQLTDGCIDIVEGINNQNANQFAIHTTEGCYHDKPTNQAGFNIDTNCSMPSGCTVGMNAQNSYMSGFASAGGGVYATQYDSSGIL